MTDPVLPAYSAIKVSSEIRTQPPKANVVASQTRSARAPRKTDAPLDKELRTTRILGGREPLTNINDTGGVKPVLIVPSDTRKTGAITRDPVRQNNTTPPIRQAPVRTPPPSNADDDAAPVKAPPTRQPPVRQEPPRSEPAPIRQPPRSEPRRRDNRPSGKSHRVATRLFASLRVPSLVL